MSDTSKYEVTETVVNGPGRVQQNLRTGSAVVAALALVVGVAVIGDRHLEEADEARKRHELMQHQIDLAEERRCIDLYLAVTASYIAVTSASDPVTWEEVDDRVNESFDCFFDQHPLDHRPERESADE